MKYLAGAIGLLVVSFSGMAQSDSINEAVNQCAQIENSLKRLVCYDKVAGKIDNYQQQAFSEVPAAAGEADYAPDDAFGMEITAKRKLAKIDSLVSTVTKKDKNISRELVLTLENGQVWKQLGDEYFKVDIGDEVTIQRASLGSFLLTVEGKNQRLRVKRLK